MTTIGLPLLMPLPLGGTRHNLSFNQFSAIWRAISTRTVELGNLSMVSLSFAANPVAKSAMSLDSSVTSLNSSLEGTRGHISHVSSNGYQMAAWGVRGYGRVCHQCTGCNNPLLSVGSRDAAHLIFPPTSLTSSLTTFTASRSGSAISLSHMILISATIVPHVVLTAPAPTKPLISAQVRRRRPTMPFDVVSASASAY